MYNATVTVFNYYESSTTGIGIWYPHVLSGVDLNTDKGAILKKIWVRQHGQRRITHSLRITGWQTDNPRCRR